MPKYSPVVAAFKAKKLIKAYEKNNCSQAKTAKKLGVTPSAVCQQIEKNPAVKNRVQAFLDSPSLDQALVNVAKEGLDATKPPTKDSPEWPDHAARHKFWKDLMVCKKYMNAEKEGPDNVNNVFIYIPAKDDHAIINAEEEKAYDKRFDEATGQ